MPHVLGSSVILSLAEFFKSVYLPQNDPIFLAFTSVLQDMYTCCEMV